MSMGDNIKRLRLNHSMSQEELAEIAGVSDKAVSSWENGTKIPRMGAIQKIADYFKIKKSSIIEDDEFPINDIEILHIKKYRILNESDKSTVDFIFNKPEYDIIYDTAANSVPLSSRTTADFQRATINNINTAAFEGTDNNKKTTTTEERKRISELLTKAEKQENK